MLQHLPSREGAIRGGVWQEGRKVEEEYSNSIACIIQEKYLQSCAKNIENFVFRPKMAIFWRAGMREEALPLPLAFQYLILMI